MTIPREKIDGFGRVYYGESDMKYPSVSTIVGQTWQEDDGFGWWREKNNGKNGMPDHEEIKEYSQNRGTLIHYTLLNPLTNEELWSEDERTSLDALKNFGDYKYSRDEKRKNAFDRYQEDLRWSKEQWKLITDKRGIDKRSSIAVEKRVLNHTSPRYAGQFDLLYEDESGDVVLADIKTSKRIYDKHKLQAVAYANATQYSVDKLEILKLHPEYKWVTSDGYKPVEVSSSDKWDESQEELWETFKKRAEEANTRVENY